MRCGTDGLRFRAATPLGGSWTAGLPILNVDAPPFRAPAVASLVFLHLASLLTMTDAAPDSLESELARWLAKCVVECTGTVTVLTRTRAVHKPHNPSQGAATPRQCNHRHAVFVLLTERRA